MSKKDKKVTQEKVAEDTEVETSVEEEKANVSYEEYTNLKNENEALKIELLKVKNDYYRAYADTDNLKKRLQNEADIANKYRAQGFVTNILPAVDSLERALDGKDVSDPFVKGVKLTYDQIVNALKQEGVTEIDCLDKPFDANYCHAIMTEAVEGKEANMVIEVLQKGYMLKDRLLRAALVKVSE